MANYVRCLVFSNENGSKETVLFTEDMKSTPAKLTPAGLEFTKESKFNINDLPDIFPIGYYLERRP